MSIQTTKTQAQRDYLSSTTDDKQKFLDAWHYHIKQLSGLGMPLARASITGSPDLWVELEQIKARLDELVLVAANEDFKE